MSRYIKDYKSHINFNCDVSELKSLNDAFKLIRHILDNTERFNDPELINQNPELENRTWQAMDPEKLMKEASEFCETNKKAGKGHKPFRFLTGSINLEPIKDNEELIQEWTDMMLGHFQKYFNVAYLEVHMNEKAPHFHMVVKNYDKKLGWGNYVDGKKIVLSGEKGRKLIQKVWREGEELMKKFCKKHKLEYKQEPYSPKSEHRLVQNFRKSIDKIVEGEKLTPKQLKNLKWFLKTDQAKKMFPDLLKNMGKQAPAKNMSEWADYTLLELHKVCQQLGIKMKGGEPISINKLASLDQETMKKLFSVIQKKAIQQANLNNPEVQQLIQTNQELLNENKQLKKTQSSIEEQLDRGFEKTILDALCETLSTDKQNLVKELNVVLDKANKYDQEHQNKAIRGPVR